MFRLTPRSSIELSATLLLGLIGLVLLLGTVDEYKAGRAFNRAMDNYSGRLLVDVHEALQAAMAAKPSYDAPQELYGKLLIDEGHGEPSRFAEAAKLFESLLKRQQASTGQASLPTAIGFAVAELEAARAASPTPEALAAALAEARSRLEAALPVYPASGDLHVNLATIALLDNQTARCKKHLGEAKRVGNISIDALPRIFDLRGLVAIREGQLERATAEFEKIREFDPDWDVPDLNLGAAQAQALLSGSVDSATAERFATSVKEVLDRLKRKKRAGPDSARLALALATHCVRVGRLPEALGRFDEAEAYGKLGWQARFNRALAKYAAGRSARRGDRAGERLLAEARAELEQAAKDPHATRRDLFISSAILGTLEAEAGRTKEAIAHFERAAAVPAAPADKFVAGAMPIVDLSLAALYCAAPDYPKAIEALERAKPAGDAKGEAEALLAQLRSAPVIAEFSAKHEKIYADYDLRVSALLSCPSAPDSLKPEGVRLTLIDTLANATAPLPFRLDGPLLQAAAVNLPQGRYRVELTLTDSIGNRAVAKSEEFEFDREPPRVVDPSPAPGTTVKKLDTVRFGLTDTVSSPDVATLNVSLRFPARSALATQYLVLRGKYVFPSPNGKIRRSTPVAGDIQCPVPKTLPAGEYKVLIQVSDTQGKTLKCEWPFTLAP